MGDWLGIGKNNREVNSDQPLTWRRRDVISPVAAALARQALRLIRQRRGCAPIRSMARNWCSDPLADAFRLDPLEISADEELMGHLKVDPELAFSTSRSLSSDAVELHEQLASVERDWENLSRGWSGVASSAYSPIWAEWLDGATTLVDSLEELSQKLAFAVSRYVEQDGSSAESIESVSLDLGL